MRYDDEEIPDLYLDDGEWVLNEVPSLPDRKTGAGDWDEMFCIGNTDGALAIVLWHRANSQSKGNYLIVVEDVSNGLPFMRVDTFVEAMDLVARWAPAVQAAAVSEALDPRNRGITPGGAVELLAAKAAYGAGYGRDTLGASATRPHTATSPPSATSSGD